MMLRCLRPAAPRRGGISLTEILISILIMGVGLVSLATLFPLGLMRVKAANDYSRSALLTRSVMSEINARDLLNVNTFIQSWYNDDDPMSPPTLLNENRNPFIQDHSPGYDSRVFFPPGSAVPPEAPVYRQVRFDAVGSPSVLGDGLPICYDPLWWAIVRQNNGSAKPDVAVANDAARFGSGDGYFPITAGRLPGAAYGLQRITNFVPWTESGPGRFWRLTFPVNVNVDGSTAPATVRTSKNIVGDVFSSPDDLVFQKEDDHANPSAGLGSPLVPDLAAGGGTSVNDWVFTWMLTGRVTDTGNQSIFDGDVVVHRNRLFGFEQIQTPFATMAGPSERSVPAGERVVAAVWGHSATLDAQGYGRGDARVVLLRWPGDQPAPELRVGGWIADVTYQRFFNDDQATYRLPYADTAGVATVPRHLGQRCHWYQVAKKSGVNDDPYLTGWKNMTVWTATPVRARTRFVLAGGTPTPLVEAALIDWGVVNVFPLTIPIK